MTNLPRAMLRLLAGDYEIYSIYFSDLRTIRSESTLRKEIIQVRIEDRDLLETEFPEVASYLGRESAAFAIRQGDRFVAACAFLWGDRYADERNFIPLAPGEAKLVQISTAAEFRGRGLARRLIAGASDAMAHLGFMRLYTRIWRTHQASEKAFTAAGWQRCAWVIGVRLLGIGPRVRVRFRTCKGWF